MASRIYLMLAIYAAAGAGGCVQDDGATRDATDASPSASDAGAPLDGMARDDAYRPVDDARAGDAADASLPPSGTPLPLASFSQGLFRGEDPRVRRVNGTYYSVFTEGTVRKMYKSSSLLDRGVGKPVPSVGGASFPLFAPIYVGQLGGQTYNAWFAFDGNEWECDCNDPFDDLDKWTIVKSLPFTGWSIDFEVFQNPQPGPFFGRYYMVWAGADSPSSAWNFESAFVAEILDLRPNQTTLSTFQNADANRLAKYAFDWTDVIVEAPAPALHGSSVSVVYSGNGAQTDDYALGIAILKSGSDPALGASWIDHNHGQCDGDVQKGPAFSRTATVFGPGVARFTQSADGSQDWMLYHSKIFDTFNRGQGTPGQQDNNEEYARQVNATLISWRDVQCGGVTYSIPRLDPPRDEGSQVTSPAGDPGLAPGLRRIEAEAMIPFGFVMGNAIQSIPRTGQGQFAESQEVLVVSSSVASNGQKVTHLDALAADVTSSPKRSGLLWRNSAGGGHLTVSSASPNAANLDLYINGAFATTMHLPATGGADAFKTSSFTVSIPFGAEIGIVYEAGKNATADLDYLEVGP